MRRSTQPTISPTAPWHSPEEPPRLQNQHPVDPPVIDLVAGHQEVEQGGQHPDDRDPARGRDLQQWEHEEREDYLARRGDSSRSRSRDRDMGITWHSRRRRRSMTSPTRSEGVGSVYRSEVWPESPAAAQHEPIERLR